MNALLLAVLLAQAQVAPVPYEPPPAPKQQQESIAVRPSAAKAPSLWTKATRALGNSVRRLWEKDEPNATKGNLETLNGDVDAAMKSYDEAEKQLPATSRDAQAALSFDRSGALLKGQQENAPKALEQAQAAMQSSDPSLRAKAAYNAGVALEQAGKPQEAIKAYAEALSMDPDDVDSKVNLELLLQDKQKKEKQQGQQQDDKKQPNDQQQQQQQQQSNGKQDDQKKQDQKQEQQQGQEQQKDQQAQQQKSDEEKKAQADQKKEEQAQQGQQQPQQGEKEEAKQEKPAQLGRSEAQRLLDAARAGEKNLQMWRFGKKSDPHKQRATAEKDW